MKAKIKWHKLLSLLLALVMLLSLLPTTALAADNYPDHVRVYNGSGTITSLSDGECLAANDAGSATNYTGGAYVARYEKSSGTLFLKGYHGVGAEDGIVSTGDLNIVVESDSSFTTSRTSTDDLMGIQASGKLNISGSGKLTVTANGNGDVYGIYANDGVTISAPLDVNVGETDATYNGTVYGIYTRSGAISLPGNDMTVTATGGTSAVYGVYNAANTSTAITHNGNITISGKLTVNLSNGSYNRGISSQGGVITLNGATVKISGSYYYGIFNKSGNVVIKSSPDVNISSDISDNRGICTYTGGDLTIENSAVKVSANGPAADLKGNMSIKDSMVELTRTSSYYEVIRTDNSSATITIDLSTEGSVTLTASGEQTNYAMITGKVTLRGSTKCEMGKAAGNSYDGAYDGSSKTVLKFVHESAAPTTYTVSGTATSFNSDTDDVTIQLIESGASEAAYEAVVQGNTASYSIAGVAPGTYTMKVMKKNHATREYTVTVGDKNVIQNVDLCMLGDINGDGEVNSNDYAMLRNYVQCRSTLTEEQKKLADINGDGAVDAFDAIQLDLYINGVVDINGK